MCSRVCTEAVHCVALERRTLSRVCACVPKYVPKQSIAYTWKTNVITGSGMCEKHVPKQSFAYHFWNVWGIWTCFGHFSGYLQEWYTQQQSLPLEACIPEPFGSDGMKRSALRLRDRHSHRRWHGLMLCRTWQLGSLLRLAGYVAGLWPDVCLPPERGILGVAVVCSFECSASAVGVQGGHRFRKNMGGFPFVLSTLSFLSHEGVAQIDTVSVLINRSYSQTSVNLRLVMDL